jgi:hypothetical protein
MILSRFAGDLPVHLGDAGCGPKQVAPAPPPPARPRTRGPAVGSDPDQWSTRPGLSAETVSRITDAVPGLAVKATGQAVCTVLFHDGVQGKARGNQVVQNKPAYIGIGADARSTSCGSGWPAQPGRPGHPHRLRGRPGEFRRCRHRRVPGCGRAAVRGPSSATRRGEDGKRNDQPARLVEGQLKAPDETSPTLARLQQAR